MCLLLLVVVLAVEDVAAVVEQVDLPTNQTRVFLLLRL
jgi:hypothetical protein